MGLPAVVVGQFSSFRLEKMGVQMLPNWKLALPAFAFAFALALAFAFAFGEA